MFGFEIASIDWWWQIIYIFVKTLGKLWTDHFSILRMCQNCQTFEQLCWRWKPCQGWKVCPSKCNFPEFSKTLLTYRRYSSRRIWYTSKIGLVCLFRCLAPLYNTNLHRGLTKGLLFRVINTTTSTFLTDRTDKVDISEI